MPPTSLNTYNDGATRITCRLPSSSVLFDAYVPTFTRLTGHMWARHLLTLGAPMMASINFNLRGARYSGYSGVSRIEILMVNCPWWGISVEKITLYKPVLLDIIGGQNVLSVYPTTASCDNLVRVCIPCTQCNTSQHFIGLEFHTPSNSRWVHIAQMTFIHGSTPSPCPKDIVVTPFTPVVSICNYTMTGGQKICGSVSIQLNLFRECKMTSLPSTSSLVGVYICCL